MLPTPPALLIKFPGTNCDAETARALEAAGFSTSIVPVSLMTPAHLLAARLVVFSGGFSYGDYVMAGRIAQLVSEVKLGESLQKFIADGGYVLGICNGFQIMTKLGILPEGSLIDNASGRFQCRWVKLKNAAPESPYLADLPDDFELPIAHAEGRFVAAEGKAEQDARGTHRDAHNTRAGKVLPSGVGEGPGRAGGCSGRPPRSRRLRCRSGSGVQCRAS